jgi:hypothetical protein
MSRLPYVMTVGAKVRSALDQLFYEDSALADSILDHVGMEDCTCLPPHTVRLFQSAISKALEEVIPAPTDKSCSCITPVNFHLLDHWRQAAKDPDPDPVDWLRFGAPAGILHPIPDRGIFPTYDPAIDVAELAASDLATEVAFCNYAGVESDADVAVEVQRLEDKGFVAAYSCLAEAEKALGIKIVLSKIGAIKRMRNGIMKLRMVVDSKKSGVSRATRKYERTQLPRALDVVYDSLLLLRELGPHEEIEYLIADFRDAFFILPNKEDERHFFAVEFRGRVLVFLRTTQGSRGAPLTWARLAALIGRLTQSVLGLEAARISTYVDDPIVVARGSRFFRRKLFAITLGMWSALGLPIAFNKGVIGSSVTWTSAVFAPTHDQVTVSVKATLVAETMTMLAQFVSGNYILKKRLRQGIGKAMHIASLVPMVRPFISELYAALCSSQPEGTQHRLGADVVWTKQIRSALHWLIHLLSEAEFSLSRTYQLNTWLGQGDRIEMCFDASPWGLGGFLTKNGKIRSFFRCGLSDAELELLSIKRAESAAQQTVEALAVLVGLRAWKSQWLHKQVVLKVRSDSVSALVIALKLKTKGVGPGIIAREMALDIAASEYLPSIVNHIPGLENVVADELSRRLQPGHDYIHPPALLGAEELVLAPRTRAYYRSTLKPSAVLSQRKWVTETAPRQS